MLPDVYQRIKPAVVAIGIVTGKGPGRPFYVGGSGFCVDPRGIIVTCRHVFEQFQELAPDYDTMLEEMRSKPGEIVRGHTVDPEAFFFFEHGPYWLSIPVKIGDLMMSAETDIVVMKAAAEYFQEPKVPYPVIAMGDSDTLREGEDVAASGFPFGAQIQPRNAVNHTLSRGVVSGILPSPNVIQSVPENFKEFQLDMAIQKGNSGGPIFRPSDGSVVGVVASADFINKVPIGIAYAIPINQAKPIITDLLNRSDEFRSRVWGPQATGKPE